MRLRCSPVAAIVFAIGLAGVLPAVPHVSAQSVVRYAAASCFPFEMLPAPLKTRAETLLLRALDSEALYTIAADIKPTSSGIVSTRVRVADPDLTEVEELRQILRTWTCGGEISAHLHHFAAVYDGSRPLEGTVVNLPALSRLVGEQTTFFGSYGLSASAEPQEVLLAVEYDRTSARFRGYGLLFGYPNHAIDFFVRAADEQAATGTFVTRDFISLPTVRGPNHFVYAVPKGHEPNEADRRLRERTEAVFADYQARRARHIQGDAAEGVLALVREWFDDGTGDVRPSNAWRP